MSTSFDADTAGLEKLDRHTCFALLKTCLIGRIVFTEGALPAIQPVNFALDGENVIIRTGMGSKLAQAARSAVVAFEGDDFDEHDLTGWSVVIVGEASAVGDEAECRRLDGLGLRPWAPGDRPYYIKIVPELVRGRRIRPHA